MSSPASTLTLGGRISQVHQGGVAWDLGLRPGDRFLAINGHPLRDVIDYRFYAAEAELTLDVVRQGTHKRLHMTKGDADLGLEFDPILFDGIKRCQNRCPFCFLKGLPEGLRASLHLRDDDYRLSFLLGNFITLTNLDDADWQRLAQQRLSPLYVSVHATNSVLRQRMLGNPLAPPIMTQLVRLRQMRIQAHCQVVLCPNVNDGTHLEQTVHDLASLHPTVLSVAVVPVGLARPLWGRSADGAAPLATAVTPATAETVIKQVSPWQRHFRTRLGHTFVYLADEFYLKAGCPLPATRNYDGFPQYENGVGMVRTLLDDWALVKRRWHKHGIPRFVNPLRVTLVCGVLIAPVLQRIAQELNQLENLDTNVVPVVNRLFGPSVTVSGLLTGTDIVEALKDKGLGHLVLISRDALNSTGHFLDDLHPEDLEQRLATPFAFVKSLSEVIQWLTSRDRQFSGKVSTTW